jgi:regulation of enolase protein 1 (concanavalin A-like superfamily)
MSELFINETFDKPTFDPRLTWFSPPQIWRTDNSSLIIEPDPKTDYWQKTHYGFVADNGHFLFTEIEGDFIITTKVHFNPRHQYDQAGLMIRISARCWLKTSVEYEPDGPDKLGVVVTNNGYSDWSTQNFPGERHELLLRIRRESSDYIVEYSLPEIEEAASPDQWIQMRMAHLQEDRGDIPLKCGLYACSPIEAGYSAAFDFLRVESSSKNISGSNHVSAT